MATPDVNESLTIKAGLIWRLGLSAAHRVKTQRRQLKSFEFKAWRNGAPNERPFAEALGGLPSSFGNDALRRLPLQNIRTERDRRPTVEGYVQPQRIARMKVPNLGCIDTVPPGSLAGFEQKKNCRRRGSAAAWRHVAKSLAVMPTLGMRQEPEALDDFVCSCGHCIAGSLK